MKNINAHFTCSAPRMASLAGYQHMLAATEEKFRTITPWHECRWLSRDSSTKTLAQSLRALLLFYNNRAFGKDAAGQWIEKDGIIRAKMKGRYHQLTRYQMLRWIYFLRDILPCLTKLSKLTQRDSLTIFDLKKGIADTDRSLENLGKEIGDEERAQISQVHETVEGNLCWPGGDGHFLRCTSSKRKLLAGVENVRQEVQAFERSRQQYIMAIIKDLDMRFTNLMKDLEDFLVLHCADQEGT